MKITDSIRALAHWFSPDSAKQSSDVLERSNYAILSASQIIASIVLLVFFLLNIVNENHRVAIAQIVSVAIFTINLFSYKRDGQYSRSAILFILTLGMLLSFQQLYAPELLFTNLMWMPCFSIFGVMLLGEFLGFFTGIIVSLLMLAAYLFPKAYTVIPDVFSREEIYVFDSVSIVFCFVTFYFVSRVFVKQKNEAIITSDQQRLELFKLNEKNRSLLAVLSHDLTNPLFAMKMSLFKIDRKYEKMSEDQKKDLFSKMGEITLNMEQLIHSVRSLQAFENGKLEVAIEKVDLLEVVQEALTNHQDLATQKQIQVKIAQDKEHYFVKSERTSLKNSVITNILTNAIKFSPKGADIEFNFKEEDEQIKLEIKDYGIGIPHEILKNLFRHDVTTSRSGTGGEKGTGFGMPIVKFYLDLYGADIDVETNENENIGPTGSTFKLAFQKSE
ncbi:HAMP domain-containing sensor histidine kinase [Halobacteriovorax sp. GB3]|uniref:sensor histidine kinase n=1 Tax=Halobacteriovorax sp. GB3 TaxID=2719615 RepID=UPI00235E143C|nr:HAMP domain-containing sensor histidine kinase [Halobacteriovorax sp. GB3]MDD0852877.1 HAMP domain-containing sensor histidine kinase [Halobacteriovorax sp. GB3]